MTLDDFRNMAMVSMEDICRDIFQDNRESIKIKKEPVGIKNLTTIFQATLKLGNEKGFQAMSLRDLCRETGLSMGALYSYFSSKDELLSIIQDQGRRITAKILSDHIKRESHPWEQMKAVIRAHLYLSEVLQGWFFFSYMETRFFRKEEHKKAIASELYTEQLFGDILEEGKRQGVFSVENSILTASVIKAMLQDWYLKRWKYSRRNISVDAYADFVISFVGRFVMSSEPDAITRRE